MGAALASSTLINAKCENISCCTSVAAVQPPVVRRTGGFLKKRMTTIYVDSRKRVAGSDSDFEVDLGESLHLQSDARLTVFKIRLADSFLSTDRGRYLYWVDAALGTLNWASLPEGAYTGPRLALQLCHRYLQRDHQQPERCLRRQQAHPERPGAAPAISRCGGLPRRAARLSRQALQRGPQQVFEFVKMMAHNEVYLRCAQLANASRVLGNLGDDVLSKITLKSGVGTIVETGSTGTSWLSGARLP